MMRACQNFLFLSALLSLNLSLLAQDAPAPQFRDSFQGKLGPGWSWVREDPSAWRVSNNGLEVRIQPGNMWGPPNNAKNLLVRSVPDPAVGEVEVSVTLTNQPTEQYEQADLVWYYDDSNMVKCGQELVDGKLKIVMGREQGDRCRTIKIVPLDSFNVSLKLVVKDNKIRGLFRVPGNSDWQEVGECDLPVKGPPRICLQFYQGPARLERWVRVTDFQIRQKL